MIKTAYIIVGMHLDDVGDYIVFSEHHFVYGDRLYLSGLAAEKACRTLNENWLRGENPIEYEESLDSSHNSRFSPSEREELHIYLMRSDYRSHNFTAYWEKLRFPGIFWVKELEVSNEMFLESITVPEDRKLEV